MIHKLTIPPSLLFPRSVTIGARKAPPLMSHEDRRKLIETPIRIERVGGAAKSWSGSIGTDITEDILFRHKDHRMVDGPDSE